MLSVYELGSGAGSSLPTPVLVLAGVSSLIAVLVSAMSVYLQLKNYRKPSLQRCVFCSQKEFVILLKTGAEWSYES